MPIIGLIGLELVFFPCCLSPKFDHVTMPAMKKRVLESLVLNCFVAFGAIAGLWSASAYAVPFHTQTEVTKSNIKDTGFLRTEIPRIGQFRFQGQTFTTEGVDPFGKESACSGYLLTNKVILTAAHCFGDMVRSYQINPKAFKENFPYAAFFRQRLEGVYLGQGIHMIKKVYIPRQYFTQNDKLPGWKFNDEVVHDFAIVILDNPVTNIKLNPIYPSQLDSKTLDNLDNQTISTLGYPGNKPDHTLWLQLECPLLEIETNDRVIKHQCETFQGQSGSPLIMRSFDNKNKIVGVITHGGYKENYGNYFLSTEIEQIKKWMMDKNTSDASIIDFNNTNVIP